MIYIQQQIENFTEDSNIENDWYGWDDTTSYNQEDLGSETYAGTVTYGNYYWKSLTDNNVGNIPSETEGVYWSKLSISNRMAMLDQQSLTRSTMIGDDIVVEFTRNQIDSIALGYLETSQITIEHLDTTDTVIDEFTKIIEFSLHENVFDLWDYIYEDYTTDVDRGLYFKIAPIGVKVRITISASIITGNSACGFLVGGEGIDMGDTLDGVGFNFNSFSTAETDIFGNLTVIRRNVQDLVDFETIIDKSFTPRARRNIKSIYDEIVVFVVDESENSFLENAVTLGKIQDASVVGEVSTKNVISWSVFETI
jgi:hypothetical protein